MATKWTLASQGPPIQPLLFQHPNATKKCTRCIPDASLYLPLRLSLPQPPDSFKRSHNEMFCEMKKSLMFFSPNSGLLLISLRLSIQFPGLKTNYLLLLIWAQFSAALRPPGSNELTYESIKFSLQIYREWARIVFDLFMACVKMHFWFLCVTVSKI